MEESKQKLQEKHKRIVDILAEVGPESTALFCPSRTQVDHLLVRCEELFNVSADSLVTIQDLRKSSPYNNLIIPGWFDKKQMRELRVSGFAQNYFMVLYPFEQEWEHVSSKAQRRWSNHLLHATSAYAKRFERTYIDFSSVERWPKAVPIVVVQVPAFCLPLKPKAVLVREVWCTSEKRHGAVAISIFYSNRVVIIVSPL